MSTKASAKVLDLEGKEVETVDLPAVFATPIRDEVIARAFVALDSHRRQPQGRDPLAGKRTTAETNNPPTGRGISRIPRVKGERYSKSAAKHIRRTSKERFYDYPRARPCNWNRRETHTPTPDSHEKERGGHRG